MTYRDFTAKREYQKLWAQKNYLKNKDSLNSKKRIWRAANKDKIRAQRARYKLRHPELVKKRLIKWQGENRIRQRFHAYKYSAKTRGYEFHLTLEQFVLLVQGNRCYYCHGDGKVGLDRVVNRIGYVLSNVVPCCRPCNVYKRRLGQGQFIRFCIAIAKNFPEYSVR